MTKPLNEDMDAQRWAREFLELWDGHKIGSAEVDEALMIAWFANAIMAGYDNARWQAEANRPEDAATWTEHDDIPNMRAVHCTPGVPIVVRRNDGKWFSHPGLPPLPEPTEPQVELPSTKEK